MKFLTFLILAMNILGHSGYAQDHSNEDSSRSSCQSIRALRSFNRIERQERRFSNRFVRNYKTQELTENIITEVVDMGGVHQGELDWQVVDTVMRRKMNDYSKITLVSGFMYSGHYKGKAMDVFITYNDLRFLRGGLDDNITILIRKRNDYTISTDNYVSLDFLHYYKYEIAVSSAINRDFQNAIVERELELSAADSDTSYFLSRTFTMNFVAGQDLISDISEYEYLKQIIINMASGPACFYEY